MDYKRLSNYKDRFIGKFKSWRIFLNKDAKYYAIHKNDKSPTFTHRTDLNRWIKNRVEQMRDQQTSNQAELFLTNSACRLTRLRDAGKDRWSKKRGLYRCTCGTEKEIDDHSVRTGKTKSCGCLNRESLRDRNKIRERAAAGGRAIKGREAPCKGLIRICEFESKYSKPRGRTLWVTPEELSQIYRATLPDPFAEPERFEQVRPYKKKRYNGNRFVKLRK